MTSLYPLALNAMVFMWTQRCLGTNTASEDVELKAYTQLVRPFLEYASCAWDSVSQSRTQENKLEAEAVQTCRTGAMQQFVQAL